MMGNACRISAVNQIVTLGGARKLEEANVKSIQVNNKPEKCKRSTTQREDNRTNRKNNTKPKDESVFPDKQTTTGNVKTTLIQIQNVAEVKKQTKTEDNEALSKLAKEKCEVLLPKQTNQASYKTKNQQLERKDDYLYAIESNSSKLRQNHPTRLGSENTVSGFNSSTTSSRQSLLLSSKHLKSEKFKTDWQREEKR